MRFEGKVAIITGAAGRIGSAATAVFAAEGCHVAALDVNEPALEALAEESCHSLQVPSPGGGGLGWGLVLPVLKHGLRNLVFG